ncbi:hypothetical protein BO70DRAFT_391991 [Aspergillus heteromorphus CBS 117.55]|uniref:Transcription elongation factor Eaf N-terminal domain-containing protein n=1 Tax=Aspergillus heteromorphus CBS 117.55 TaxID=1448321 RepID=A0A317X6V0_9EURO|nr:uncharacterized protein BO70DRAFT_391991 [Aspergillus heteromorphus CBS 117.55]PWY92598.1 hypothetical protein BO70DRAFT_391991 [Aspergillus heteromorphus CBS 117.55]
MAAPALSTGGLIDPTKQAEYPIVLGDRLAGRNGASQSPLVNVQYNYKTKSATARQRITRSRQSRDRYNLTITDKAPSTGNVLTYSYQGSVDPAQAVSDSGEHNLVLVFDAARKVFVLEPVATQLNFNLRSAPAKSQKQVLEQHAQLRTLQEDDHGSGDDRASDTASGNDDGPADDSNPYDYRHFLPKESADDEKSGSDKTPEIHFHTSKVDTPLLPATKPTPSPRPRPESRPTPVQSKKKPEVRQPKPTATKARPKSPVRTTQKGEDRKPKTKEKEPPAEASRAPPPEIGPGAVSAQTTVPSPGSNIIIDGDLIIDMGSPPPSRPFKVNPAHFSSNNTPANGDDGDDDEDDEDIEALRLPSPAGHGGAPAVSANMGHGPAITMDDEDVDEEDDDDALAAEMEAAFEESAREEEEARSQQSHSHPASHQYHVVSEDESDVSEEE